VSREVPYGAWPTRLPSSRITAGSTRLSQPRLDADHVYWLEGRPSEGGRQVVVRQPLDATRSPEDVSPAGMNVRTRVHEYGGGEYCIQGGRLCVVDFADGRIHTGRPGGPLTPITAAGVGYADLVLDPSGDWLVCVEERDTGGREPENRLVAFRLPGLDATAGVLEPIVVMAGHDFVSSPVFSPGGDRLACLVWDHPDMPWDATALHVVGWSKDGPTGTPRSRTEGERTSIFQPGFTPDGRLVSVSDRSGWWNLYVETETGPRPVCPMAAEFGRAQWVFGMSSWAAESDDRLLCAVSSGGRDRLTRVSLADGARADLGLDLCEVGGLRVLDGTACFLGASEAGPPAIYSLDLETRALRCHRSASDLELDPADIARPEAIEFPTRDGARAYAFYYPPTHAEVTGPSDERPPLLVKTHGGPTSGAQPGLDLRIQYWTQCGIGVVDVNYGGSTGYGRAFRDSLKGQWGIVDVADACAAARFLADAGRVDGGRLAISGGSAGGYTTLCALTFTDVFHAGASHYGIGDLEALARDTHKFEARYMDSLVGPYPERRDLYRERSPIHHTEQLACPIIFFQGLDDRVVPPNQAQAMAAALAARGIPHAYVPFEGEQHGFRRAENIETALDGERYFYSRVFGFACDVHPEAVVIENAAGLGRG